MLCMGAAGCGKSTVIHELLRQILDEQLGPVCVTGYTGVSCTPFLSPTLLTMCNLSVRNLGDDARPTGTQLIKFADRFRMTTGCSVTDLAGLIVDEVSFITAEGLENYTTCPRTVAEVEGVMAGGAWPPAKDAAPDLNRKWAKFENGGLVDVAL